MSSPKDRAPLPGIAELTPSQSEGVPQCKKVHSEGVCQRLPSFLPLVLLCFSLKPFSGPLEPSPLPSGQHLKISSSLFTIIMPLKFLRGRLHISFLSDTWCEHGTPAFPWLASSPLLPLLLSSRVPGESGLLSSGPHHLEDAVASVPCHFQSTSKASTKVIVPIFYFAL